MRLTNTIRNEIINEVTKKLVKPKVHKVMERMQKFVDKVSTNMYTNNVQDWIDKAPTGALMSRRNVKIYYSTKNKSDKYFKHELIALHSSSYVRAHDFTLTKSRKVLQIDQYSNGIELTKKADIVTMDKATKKLDDIANIKKETLTIIKSALYTCTTIKQLKDNYPELSEYLPVFEEKTKALMVTNNIIKKSLTTLAA